MLGIGRSVAGVSCSCVGLVLMARGGVSRCRGLFVVWGVVFGCVEVGRRLLLGCL